MTNHVYTIYHVAQVHHIIIFCCLGNKHNDALFFMNNQYIHKMYTKTHLILCFPIQLNYIHISFPRFVLLLYKYVSSLQACLILKN